MVLRAFHSGQPGSLWSRDHLWLTSARRWFLLLAFFSLPLSKSAPIICVFLCSLLWAFDARESKFPQLRNNNFSIYLIVLYLIHPLSLLWSDDIAFGVQRSLDYSWILFVSAAILQYRESDARAYLLSFVLGASIHALFFYLGFFEVFHLLDSTAQDPAISGNRNTYGPLVAIAGIATVYLTMTSTWTRSQKLSGLPLALLLLLTVLLNTSRTGHLVLLALALSSALYLAFLNHKKLLAALLVGVVVSTVLMSAQVVETVQGRISQAITDVHLSKTNPLTSAGIRISFYRNTIELQSKRPLTEQVIGSGVGDYVDDYNAFVEEKKGTLPGLRKNKDDIQGWNRFRDLHSQFLMNLLKFGYLGVILVAALVAVFAHKARKEKSSIMTSFFVAVFFALMVNSLSQSAMETRGLAPAYFLLLGILFADLNKRAANRE